ncbi:MAG: hypothetical protein ACP5HS_02810 [Anaerolineae bacterium]
MVPEAIRDVAEALMTHPHPSVRVRALKELAGRSADAPEVRKAQALVDTVPPVRDILDAQYPDGYWMHPGLGISPRYRATVWQLLFLAQLGAGPSPPVVRAVEVVLANDRDDAGALRLHQGADGRSLALTGAFLWSVAQLGLADQATWASTWAWVTEELEAGRVSPSAAVWLGRAAGAWRQDAWLARWTATGTTWERTVPKRRLALQPTTAPSLERRFSFPLTHRPDALAALRTWVEIGRPDLVPETAVQDLLSRQLPSGHWPLEKVDEPLWFELGTIGQANPWITLRVLCVLCPVLDKSPRS